MEITLNKKKSTTTEVVVVEGDDRMPPSFCFDFDTSEILHYVVICFDSPKELSEYWQELWPT